MSITLRSAQTIRNGVTLQGAERPWPGAPRSYRYWKFSVARIANPVAEGNTTWQIGELVLKYHGQRIDYTTATASSTSGAEWGMGEDPSKAIDNIPHSKFCSVLSGEQSGLGFPLLIDFGKTVTADSMTYFTGNDIFERDPVNWILWGSADNTNWDPVQWTSGYTPPSERDTETAEFLFQPAFAHHITVPVSTGGIVGNNEYVAWCPAGAPANTVPVGATAFGTNLNNHIGGIYTVTSNILDSYQKISVVGAAGSVAFLVTNVGSNENFEAYWN